MMTNLLFYIAKHRINELSNNLSSLFNLLNIRRTKRNKNQINIYEYSMLEAELLSTFEKDRHLLKFVLRVKKKFDWKNDEWVRPWLLDRSLKIIQDTNLGLNVQDILERNGITENEKPIIESTMSKFIENILTEEKDYDF